MRAYRDLCSGKILRRGTKRRQCLEWRMCAGWFGVIFGLILAWRQDVWRPNGRQWTCLGIDRVQRAATAAFAMKTPNWLTASTIAVLAPISLPKIDFPENGNSSSASNDVNGTVLCVTRLNFTFNLIVCNCWSVFDGVSVVKMSEYWVISAPGEKTCQQTWDSLNNATKSGSLSVNYKFPIPDLKVRQFLIFTNPK